MTSAVSFKDKFKQGFSIFKWDLKNCTGTLAVYSIIVAALMIVAFTLCITIGSYDFSELEAGTSFVAAKDVDFTVPLQVFQLISVYIIYVMTVVFTIFYTVRVFSYLHDKRKADLYGALPLSRITLFISKSAVAFLFSLVPAMFFVGVMSIISVCMGQPIVLEVVQVYSNLVMGTLASIAAYGLLAVCCGTTVNAVIMFIAICIAYPMSALFVKGVIGGFFPGYDFALLSKTFVINALNPLYAYEGDNVIYWTIFTIVCMVAAALLIKKRKAERAQSSFAYYLPCHLVKILVSFLMGMFLGVIFGSLNVLGYGYAGFVFGFIVAAVPTYIIAHLIFYKGFSKLLKTSITLAGLIVVVFLGMAVCNFDIFGYTTYVPHKDDVKSAGFVDFDHYFVDEKDAEKIAKNAAGDFADSESVNLVLQCHESILEKMPQTSEEKFQNVWTAMILDTEMLGFRPASGYIVSYQLNNNSVITRNYTNYDVYTKGLFDESLSKLVNSLISDEVYVRKYSAMANAETGEIYYLGISGIDSEGCEQRADVDNGDPLSTVFGAGATTSPDKPEQWQKDIDKIVEAFRKDFEADKTNTELVLSHFIEGEEPYYDYVYSNGSSVGIDASIKENPDVVCQIALNASELTDRENMGFLEMMLSSFSTTTYETFIVPKSYTNTINALQEIGILNSDLTMNIRNNYLDPYYNY